MTSVRGPRDARFARLNVADGGERVRLDELLQLGTGQLGLTHDDLEDKGVAHAPAGPV